MKASHSIHTLVNFMTYQCYPLLLKKKTEVHEWKMKDTLYLTERETEKGNFQDSSAQTQLLQS